MARASQPVRAAEALRASDAEAYEQQNVHAYVRVSALLHVADLAAYTMTLPSTFRARGTRCVT